MLKKVTSALAGLAVMAAAGTALAQERWNMATPYPDAAFHTQNVRAFAEDVKRLSDGALEITVHSGGTLFKHPQIKRSVQRGLVPAGEVLMSLLGNEDPLYTVDSIPFLATGYSAAEKLWQVSRPAIEARLAEDGLVLLYAVPWPAQGLYTARPAAALDDLKGINFRAYNNTTARLATLAGMVPTQVEVPEIPTAFATGIVEAMITSPSTGANSKAWDFVGNFYDVEAWLPKNMIIVNRRAFERLPEAVQAAVREAAKAAETRGWQASAAEAAAKKKVLADNGMNIAAPSDALSAALNEIGTQMVAEWLEKTGDQGQAIIDAYRR